MFLVTVFSFSTSYMVQVQIWYRYCYCLSLLSQVPYVFCCKQGHVDSKTLFQPNLSIRYSSTVLNFKCCLTQVVLYNCHKTGLIWYKIMQ